LYNGIEKFDEKEILKLSNAFETVEDFGDIKLELEVEVYNINYGCNADIFAKNNTLRGYSFFVDKIRTYSKTLSQEEAIKKAVQDCMHQNILKDFLKSISSEVINMLFAEWDQDVALAVRYEEGLERGLEQGLERGLEQGLERGLEKGIRLTATNLKKTGMPLSQIADVTGLLISEIERI
jgi:predicted transposase/invertase (TIGR01784 family)